MNGLRTGIQRLVLAFAMFLLGGAASAQDWAMGQGYESQCAACHRSPGGLARPLTGRTPSLTATQLYNGIHSNSIMSSYNSWTVTNELADLAFFLANPNGPPVMAPVASLSPTSLSFGNQTQSISSAPLTATLRNTGTANLTISSLTLGGANAAEFTRSGTCAVNGVVAPASSCSITVTFTPAVIGTRSASISIAHNAAGSPTTLNLSGSGIVAQTMAPVIALSPTTLDFGTVALQVATPAKTVTVSNTGNAPMAISAFNLGGTNAADFGATSTCSLTTPLAAGGNCTISVTFTPTVSAARSATLTVVSNATGTNTVTLRGTGAGTPPTSSGTTVSLSSTTLSFGNRRVGDTSRARRVRLTNTGGTSLTISAIDVTGDFLQESTCASAPLAPQAVCTIYVRFRPTAAGVATGNLTISSNASGSPHQVSLSGTGTTGRKGSRDEVDECDEDDATATCSPLVSPVGKPAKSRD